MTVAEASRPEPHGGTGNLRWCLTPPVGRKPGSTTDAVRESGEANLGVQQNGVRSDGRTPQRDETTDLSFVIRHSSFVIRHSSFVIRHSSLLDVN
jgi:hypothetical protein